MDTSDSRRAYDWADGFQKLGRDLDNGMKAPYLEQELAQVFAGVESVQATAVAIRQKLWVRHSSATIDVYPNKVVVFHGGGKQAEFAFTPGEKEVVEIVDGVSFRRDWIGDSQGVDQDQRYKTFAHKQSIYKEIQVWSTEPTPSMMQRAVILRNNTPGVKTFMDRTQEHTFIVKDSKVARGAIEKAESMRTLQDSKVIGAFPDWSMRALIENYKDLGTTARVYYTGDADQQKLVQTLITEREPINITNKRYYGEDALKKKFGWRRSHYARYYEKEQGLPPNLAVFTRALVRPPSGKEFKINVLNSVGFAFDEPNQADYKHFSTHHFIGVKIAYRHMFALIFKAARDQEAKTLVMSMVGANNFASKYPRGRDAFRTEVWEPEFRQALENSSKKPKVLFMGAGIAGFTPIGKFPELLDDFKEQHGPFEDALFVNAWDPHSMAGNGNAFDNSLDGWIGRFSSIAVSAWPLTNAALLNPENYIAVAPTR